MKTNILHAIVALALCLGAYAQETMITVWEKKLDHKTMNGGYVGTGFENEFSYAASDKEITVFKPSDGSTVWSGKFKEIAPNLRKIDELVPLWNAQILFLFDRKLGKDQIACVDLSNGKLLWTTEKYQNISEENLIYIEEKKAFAISLPKSLVMIDAQTGEELWQSSVFSGSVAQYYYNPNDKTITLVNFRPEALVAFFTGYKNQIARMNTDNGEMLWEQTYRGKAEKKVISKEFIFELDVVENDKVYLRLNGLQVYDYKTGTPLWNAAFDFTPDGVARKPVGEVKAFGIYGAVANPIYDGDFVYILDMTNRRKQFVKKYNKNTGKLIWTSPELKGGAKAVPNMYVLDDKLVLQIGGAVEVQSIVTKKNSDGSTTTTTKIAYENVKPNGIQAFNTENGAFVWESERFKKGITNMVAEGGNLYVCSGKAYYGINAKDGSDLFEVNVKKDGVGLAQRIIPYQDKIAVIGVKGIAMHDMKSGKIIKASKYKASEFESLKKNIVIMKTAKSDIAAFDLNDGTFTQMKAKNGATTHLTGSGDYVYIYENKKVKKVKTKG